MARVDSILQAVKSGQVIALQLSIMGEIVDSEPRVCSCWSICFCRLSTEHVAGECWQYFRNGHWARIRIHCNASRGWFTVSEYLFSTEITQVSVTHSLQHRTPPNVGDIGKLQPPYDQFSSQTRIYIIFCTLIMHIICWKSLAEKRRFPLSSLQSRQ